MQTPEMANTIGRIPFLLIGTRKGLFNALTPTPDVDGIVLLLFEPSSCIVLMGE